MNKVFEKTKNSRKVSRNNPGGKEDWKVKLKSLTITWGD